MGRGQLNLMMSLYAVFYAEILKTHKELSPTTKGLRNSPRWQGYSNMSRRTFWEVRLMSGYTCNPRYNTPSPDVLRKLELSRLEAENIETREMRCPICGFLVRIIPVTQTDIVFVKCRKCKFDGALSPAYFRRIRNCRGNRMQWEEL